MIEDLKKLQAEKGMFVNHGELSLRLEKDNHFRKRIEDLAETFLHKKVSGCRNCYTDTYMELINLNIDIAMKKSECKFKLLAGALLRDINRDNSRLCSNANLTDDLALYHLKTNPSCKELFDILPEGWEKLVEDYKLPEGTKIIEVSAKADSNPEVDVKQLQEQIDQLREKDTLNMEEIGRLTKSNTEKDKKLQELENLITEYKEQAENSFIAEIAEQLKQGVTKTAIREKYKQAEIGKVKLTTRSLDAFIVKAEELNAQANS